MTSKRLEPRRQSGARSQMRLNCSVRAKKTSVSKRKWRFWIEPDQKTIRGIVFPAKVSSFFASRDRATTTLRAVGPWKATCAPSYAVRRSKWLPDAATLSQGWFTIAPLGSILRMRLPGSDEPKRSMSRQRANGELICIVEKRAGSSSALQNADSGKSSNLPLSWFARKPLPGSGIHRDLLQSSAAAFCNRIQDATTSFRRHDLENGRVGSIVRLSGFRDEVHFAS